VAEGTADSDSVTTTAPLSGPLSPFGQAWGMGIDPAALPVYLRHTVAVWLPGTH
jgi:hypothetical protein